MMGATPQKTIVVTLKLKKKAVLLLVALALFMSVCIGAIAGVVIHNTAVGIAVSVGIAVMISVLLGVVFWMLK